MASKLTNSAELSDRAGSGPVRLSRGKLAAFSLIMLVGALALVEIVFRAAGARPFEAIPNNPYTASPLEMEWVLKPGAAVEWPPDPALAVSVRTNSLGLRDGEIPPKPTGERRVIFLGDSVVFGSRLPQDETLPQLLQRAIGAGARVINAGVEGYTTFQELHLLRHVGLKTEPDFVIVGFVWNDVYEHFRTMRRFGGDGNYMGIATQSIGEGVGRWLLKSAALTQIALWQARTRKTTKSEYSAAGLNYDVSEIFKSPPEPHIEKAWDDTLAQLAALRDLAAANGLPMMVVLFPYDMQFNPATPHPLAPNERMREFCRANEIVCYDLYDVFAAAPDRSGLYLPGDGTHLSPDGAAYAAGRLADFITRHKLLDQSPATIYNAASSLTEH